MHSDPRYYYHRPFVLVAVHLDPLTFSGTFATEMMDISERTSTFMCVSLLIRGAMASLNSYNKQHAIFISAKHNRQITLDASQPIHPL